MVRVRKLSLFFLFPNAYAESNDGTKIQIIAKEIHKNHQRQGSGSCLLPGIAVSILDFKRATFPSADLHLIRH